MHGVMLVCFEAIRGPKPHLHSRAIQLLEIILIQTREKANAAPVFPTAFSCSLSP
jgi:hypothetical protein